MELDDSFFNSKTKTINDIKLTLGASILIETDSDAMEIGGPFYYSSTPKDGIFHVYLLNKDKKCIEHKLISMVEVNDISVFLEHVGVKKDGNPRNEEKPKSKPKQDTSKDSE